MTLVAIVPARSGSVRVPNKNIAEFDNKTLIEHAVEYCLACKADEIIVSSDSDTYLGKVKAKAVRLHKRSKIAASNQATDFDVVNDILKSGLIEDPESLIAWVRPCSPFRSLDLFSRSMAMISKNKNSSVRSIKAIVERPEWMIQADENFVLKPILASNKGSVPSNMLEPLYIWSGQLDMFFLNNAIKSKELFSSPVIGMVDTMSKYSLDIDNQEQMLLAQLIFSQIAEAKFICDY